MNPEAPERPVLYVIVGEHKSYGGDKSFGAFCRVERTLSSALEHLDWYGWYIVVECEYEKEDIREDYSYWAFRGDTKEIARSDGCPYTVEICDDPLRLQQTPGSRLVLTGNHWTWTYPEEGIK
jgi:hypothetical protein